MVFPNLAVNPKEFFKLQKKYGLKKPSELAHRIGVSRSQLWRVLTGKNNPGERFIAGFKNAFPEENFDQFFLLLPLQQSDTEENILN